MVKNTSRNIFSALHKTSINSTTRRVNACASGREREWKVRRVELEEISIALQHPTCREEEGEGRRNRGEGICAGFKCLRALTALIWIRKIVRERERERERELFRLFLFLCTLITRILAHSERASDDGAFRSNFVWSRRAYMHVKQRKLLLDCVVKKLNLWPSKYHTQDSCWD